MRIEVTISAEVTDTEIVTDLVTILETTTAYMLDNVVVSVSFPDKEG